MSQVFNLNPLNSSYSTRPESHRLLHSNTTPHQDWSFLLAKLKCKGKFSCLFSDNRREVPTFLYEFLFTLSTGCFSENFDGIHRKVVSLSLLCLEMKNPSWVFSIIIIFFCLLCNVCVWLLRKFAGIIYYLEYAQFLF